MKDINARILIVDSINNGANHTELCIYLDDILSKKRTKM